jgi:type I restriction enzyme S subunit
VSYPKIAIEEFCQTGSGGTPSRKVAEYYGGSIPWIKSGDLRENIVTHASEYITELALKKSSANIVPKGAILLAMYGATVGRMAILGIEAATNQAVCSIIPDPNRAYDRYLYYALRSKVPVFLRSAVGGAQPNISQGLIRSTKILLPPLGEQKRIAAILDKADALRRKRQQAIDLADQFLRSVFLEIFGDPVTNPKGWPVYAVGEITDCIVPGRDKPKSFTGGTPWVTTNDLVHLGTTYEPENFKGLSEAEIAEVRARVVPKDAVLMTCVGDLGVISIAGKDMVINQQLHAFLSLGKTENSFLAYALSFQKGFMLTMASNTTVPYMNKTICNSVPLALPPMELQRKFDEIYRATQKTVATMTAFSTEASGHFNSLSQQAFSDQL